MKITPHVIQLSRLKPPELRRGRPYTVDFGIAKPLYKQVLSKLVSGAHPHWRLITGRKASTRNKLGLITGLVSIYLALIMPLNTPPKIVYADPLINPPHQTVLPMLTMPSVSAVEAVSELPLPITPPSPPNTFANAYLSGQCTAGIAGRIHVPNNLGNAGDWAANAIADGYSVGYVPVVGTVAQTSGDSYLGHVALVEEVYADGSFLIWEMNGLYGPFTTDERVTTTTEFPNFIHF